jgi:hypothetical protein
MQCFYRSPEVTKLLYSWNISKVQQWTHPSAFVALSTVPKHFLLSSLSRDHFPISFPTKTAHIFLIPTSLLYAHVPQLFFFNSLPVLPHCLLFRADSCTSSSCSPCTNSNFETGGSYSGEYYPFKAQQSLYIPPALRH